MSAMHEYLKTAPFDLPALHLFHLVATHRSFTKAGQAAGLTQSAVTRQVQGMERQLGVALFERTTRTVELTAAGQALLARSGPLLGDIDEALRFVREKFAGAKKVVRVGVSRNIGLAYLPGFFHANLRRLPELAYRVSSVTSGDILSRLESHELDLGVLSAPRRLPRTLRVTHRFTDAFTLVAAAEPPLDLDPPAWPAADRRRWMMQQNWLLPDEESNTGRELRRWMRNQGWIGEPAMQLDGFDLIASLVTLGMGVAFVPIRSLALHGRRRTLQRLAWPDRFTRELVVIVRRHRPLPEHLARFIENVLF